MVSTRLNLENRRDSDVSHFYVANDAAVIELRLT